jgi:light-regulated signal transduction histidine kinase (bacteriophytochrome)
MELRERVIVEDVEESPIFAGTPALEVLRAAGVRAVQSTPIISRAGVLVGMLSTHYWAPTRPSERDLRLIDLLARQAADLIEKSRAEESLRRSNQQLLRANEDLNQFAFAASHDLQEPLRMITTYSQLLLKGYRGQLSGDASACVEFITDGTARMRELLADLLAYTRLSVEAHELAEAVDLNLVFHKTTENCRAAIQECHATVTRDPLPSVPGHETHFLQLFQNLIGNALKYRAGCPPRIHVSAAREGGFWRIAVADNGIGIEPEYHQKIFGLFKRLHGRAIPGTGIGLAICQRVVERYGGRIWVESQRDEGATFYFTLPAVREVAAAQE